MGAFRSPRSETVLSSFLQGISGVGWSSLRRTQFYSSERTERQPPVAFLPVPLRGQNRCTAWGAKSPMRQRAMPTIPSPPDIHGSATVPVMIPADASTMAICSAAAASS
jgi:hypothetical protein